MLLFICKDITEFRSTQMDSRITKRQLKKVLAPDIDRLVDDVVEAMNNAKPGNSGQWSKYWRMAAMP